jgi:zinc transport system substrate-binding protein
LKFEIVEKRLQPKGYSLKSLTWRMNKVIYKGQFLVKIIVLLVFVLCPPSLVGGSSDKLVIYTVNYPLKYFAERVGGDHVQVVFPVPTDEDPAYWMPDKKTISDYQKSDLILLNGAHYAKWIEKVTLPPSKMVNTSRKFRDQYIRLKQAVTHSHGPEGEHAHEDAAFTIWLDFSLAAKQAEAIERALSRKRPELKDTFQSNYAALEKDLMALDRDIEEIVGDKQGKPLVVSHPLYDYLTRRYGLNVKSVHWEPDETPGYLQWMELKRILKNYPAEWMIWEGEPLSESAEGLKSMGLSSIVFNPCGNVPDEGDFLSVMKKNVENLRRAFQ